MPMTPGRETPSSSAPLSATTRIGALAAAVSGVLFLAFPLLRPWPDEATATPELAAAFASDRWMLAHVSGAVALLLVPGALLAVAGLTRVTPGATAARAATVAAWLSLAGILLFFGAETFGIHVIAAEAVQTWDPSFLDAVEDLRNQPLAVTLFGAGLVLLAAAGALLAVAVWRSGSRRWAGLAFGAALVGVLPQFFTPPSVRIAHGVLYAVGALILAAWLTRAAAARSGRRPSA
ncbi:conserved hypothetical protein [Beutenbergia cavernae DSM 12333]|uniref:DUF4386 family protein n=1 Tax=Beutenbergia cavernae (strain ATCC BAA-8 / DSM 12333 / CCUG 43141 / JCM 11478 / NBRC 16432 / NCIMB 13614 / HKI 0122) TaxID=471853 RepID=C5C2Z3_BEUC1|nr:hypothetical protein [Beutenbergia cavernae]ACQ81837.1 conserved hypothetical protein [Beutenbergia cavernae DSM 12333]